MTYEVSASEMVINSEVYPPVAANAIIPSPHQSHHINPEFDATPLNPGFDSQLTVTDNSISTGKSDLMSLMLQ